MLPHALSHRCQMEPQPLMWVTVKMNSVSGLLTFNSVSPTSRSPWLNRDSNENLLWLTLPCMAVAPQAGSRAEAGPCPLPCSLLSSISAAWGKSRNEHQCAHLLLSSLLAPSFYNPLQKKMQISLLSVFISTHSRLMVNNLNGRILLSSVRESLSRQMEARGKKLYGWNVSGKNSTFFFKKRTLPNTVWGILQKAPFVEAEGNPPPPQRGAGARIPPCVFSAVDSGCK